METQFRKYSATERLYLRNLFENTNDVVYSPEDGYDHWDARYLVPTKSTIGLGKLVIIEAKVRDILYSDFMIEMNKFRFLKEEQEKFCGTYNVQLLYMMFIKNDFNNVYYYDLTNMNEDDLYASNISRKKYTAIDSNYKNEPAYFFKSPYKQMQKNKDNKWIKK